MTNSKLRSAGLFDEQWYRDQNKDIGKRGDAYEHYLTKGIRASISPSPLFDVGFYAKAYSGINFQEVDPIRHYLSTPVTARHDPHPLFDRAFYRTAGPELPNDIDPFLHYLAGQDGRWRASAILFNPKFYLQSYPDVAKSGMLPLRHFVVYGAREKRNPHPLFNVDWYLQIHPEAAEYGNPLLHYMDIGAAKGYSPHPLFDPQWYLSQTDDADAKAAPLRHYLEKGSAHGLSPHRQFDPRWYRQYQLNAPDSAEEALCHYLTEGAAAGLDPNPNFDTVWYTRQNPDVIRSGSNPFLHYIRYGAREMRAPRPTDRGAYNSQTLGDDAVKASDGSQQKTPANSSDDTAARRPETLLRDRRNLSFVVAANSDDAGARRVIGYFDILDELISNRSQRVPGASAKSFSSLIERMRLLAKSAFGSPPIKASVIIPVFNHVEYTIACVISLLEHKNSSPFEIIIANDSSTDETRDVFEAIGGILRCVTTPKNSGFLKNCNMAASQAVGKYIVLLNNDTLVLDYWLDELIAPFDRFTKVGLVGSKLLNSDGTLQEAGGIIWRDGTGWNFGRGQDPTLCHFNYLKDVDYVSAASVAVAKSAWDEIGGFDERFSPAYCEDTDLAFQIRGKGLRTIYSPSSQVIHHEGVSHGTNVAAGYTPYQDENRVKFLAKWASVLRSEHYANSEEVFLARDRSRGRKHMLVIDHYVPKFDRDGGSRMMFDYLKMFVDCGIQVSFWPENLHYDRDYTRVLQGYGIEVLYGIHLTGQFTEWIAQNGTYLDYAFVSRAHIASHFVDAIAEHSRARILYYGHDLTFPRLEAEYTLTGRAEILREIEEWRAHETKIWNRADVIYYPREDEVAWVKRQVPDKTVHTFPIQIYPDSGIKAARARLDTERRMPPAAMFVGGFAHRPNVDAILWYVREVLPLVKREIPEVATIVAGSHPPREVTDLVSDDVVVTGYISDPLLEWFYLTVDVVVAPLRFGGGMKGKVIEAIRFGTPVVTTPSGAEGFDGAERFLTVATTADEFAKGVISAIQNPRPTRAQVNIGLDYIQREFAYSSVAARLTRDIPELARAGKERGLLKQ